MADSEVKVEAQTKEVESTSAPKETETGTEQKISVKEESNQDPAQLVKKEDSEEKPTELEKKEDSNEEPTELEKKIITQIEYYFGDQNLIKDKFLQGKIKEDDGWVALTVLLTFNRLKAMTEDPEVIVKAMKKSSKNLVEVSEDGTKLRRKPEKQLPNNKENWKEEEWKRTVYVKGFPVDSTIDLILDFFKNEGNVINVFMRKKYHSKVFKGSIFATFEDRDQAQAFVKKEGQKYKNTLLIKEMRQDYQVRKQNEFTKRKEEREKRKQEKQGKGEDEEEEEIDFNPEEDMQKDCLMKLTGFSEGTSREDIKEVLTPHGKIAYVDFKIGEDVAVVRFEESGVAKDVYEKSKTGDDEEKKLMIKDAEITATFPEGEEEIAYWKKIMRAKSNFNKERRNHKRRGGFSGGRGGKRGRSDFRGRGRGGRGRSYDRTDGKERNGDSSRDRKRVPAAADSGDGPPEKKVKEES